MNYQILFHIIELILFLVSIVLVMLRDHRIGRSAWYKPTVLIILPATVVGGILLGIYDDVVWFSDRPEVLLRLSIVCVAILITYMIFRGQYRALDIKYRRLLRLIVILLLGLCFS